MSVRLFDRSMLVVVCMVVTAGVSFPCRGDDAVVPQTSGQGWVSGDYVYDGAGNIVEIGTASAPDSNGKQSVFVYDGANRLTAATLGRADGDRTESWQYDAFGNMQKRFVNGGEVGIGPTSTITNRMEMRRYDEVGNVVGVVGDGFTAYAYDPLNRMVEKDWDSLSSERYLYTPGDERIGVAQTTGSATQWTWTVRDFDGKPIRQFSSGNSGWQWLEDFVWRDGQLTGAERAAGEGGRRHFHLDHLGSARLVTGASGVLIARHDYAPFGAELTPIHQEPGRAEPLKFTGHERDYLPLASENMAYLDYMHARYYSPAVGRFLSIDPTLDVKRASASPQAWNRYAYVENNPILATDPDGCELSYSTDMYRPRPDNPTERALRRSVIAGLLIVGAFAGVDEAVGAGVLTLALARFGASRALTFALANGVVLRNIAQGLALPPGTVPSAPQQTTVIGRMDDIADAAAANPQVFRMNIPWKTWNAMSKADQIKAVAGFAAQAGLRGDVIAKVSKSSGNWTKLEIAVMNTTKAVTTQGAGQAAILRSEEPKHPEP